MADIRLKKVTVEPNGSPLIIQHGDLKISNTTISSSAVNGALLIEGGIGINTSVDSTSCTAGGALTIGGGAAVLKSLQIGGDNVLDSSIGIFRIKGISEDRMIVDSVINKKITFAPDGVNKRVELFDTYSSFNHTKPSSNSTSGGMVIQGGLSIAATENSSSITAGGALSINGGVAINKKLFVGEGISALGSNTIGNIFTTGGNVGIETVTPLSRLSITSNITEAKITLWDSGSTVGHFGFGVSDNQLNYHVYQSNDRHVFYSGGKNGNGTELMCIQGNGFVGVNTSVPNYRLDINGTTRIQSNALLISDTNTVGNIFTTGGNVGVGTTAPGSALHVAGTMGVSPLGNGIHMGLDSSSNAGIQLNAGGNTVGSCYIDFGFSGNDNTTRIIHTNINDSLQIQSPGGYINLASTGNVGIGIASPNEMLDVSGSAKIRGERLMMFANDTNNGFHGLGISTNSLRVTVPSTGSHFISFGSNSDGNYSEQMRIHNNGNVGIGTTSPSFTLDVNGTARFSTGITSGSAQITNANVTTSTIATLLNNDAVSTNITSATLNLTTGITSASAQITNANVTTSTIATLLNTNTVSTNITSATLNLTTGITSASAQISNANVTTSTMATLLNTNTVSTNITSATLNLTTGITSASAQITIANITTLGSDFISSNTITGGSISLSGNINVGGKATIYGSADYINSSKEVIKLFNSSNVKRFSVDLDTITNNFSLARYNLSSAFIENVFTVSTSTGSLTFDNTTASTSNNIASIIIKGGLSIQGSQDATSLTNGGSITVAGGVSLGKQLFVGGNVQILSTTISNNVSSGALLIAGGVGVSGALNVLGNTVLNGNLTVKGTTTSVESNNTVLKDNVIVLNSGPSGSKDSGLIIQRYQQDNNSGTGDVVTDTRYIVINLPSQFGVPNNQLKLNSAESSVDNYYTGWWVRVASGFSSNQVRKIISYTGSTRIATLSTPFDSQNPSENDNVYLYNKSYVGLIYNELDDQFVFGSSVEDPGSGTVNFTDNIPLKLYSGVFTSTQPCTSVSVGSMITNGGITILNTSDALSLTSGGTILTLGGAAVAKTLLVGQSVSTNNIYITGDIYQNGNLFVGSSGGSGSGSSQWSDGTAGDIYYMSNVGIGTSAPAAKLHVIGSTILSGNVTIGTLVCNNSSFGNLSAQAVGTRMGNTYSNAFNAANNVGSASNVTGFSFDNSTIRSFVATVTVSVLKSSGGNLYETFTLEGHQTDSGWTLLPSSFGDVSGITLSITGSGQIQYTSINHSNWTSTTIRFMVSQMYTNGDMTAFSGITSGSIITDSVQINNTNEYVEGVNNGALKVKGGSVFEKSVAIWGTTNSSGIGTGGSLTVLGGAAVSKDMFIGEDVFVSGNVGIGRSTPSYALDVNGSLNVGGNSKVLIMADANVGDARLNVRDFSNRFIDFYHGATTVGSITGFSGTMEGLNFNNGRMVLDSRGNIGIGTTSPVYSLQVVGDVYASGDVISFSDERLKTNIETIENAVDKIEQLRGVYYTHVPTQKRSIGLIAQETQSIIPEVVTDKGKDNYMGLAYGNIVGMLVEGIKELSESIKQLKEDFERHKSSM
jgi:hypothetical protein